MIPFLAFILQIQCGFQTIGSLTASYGTIVYVSKATPNTPQVAFFKTYADPGKPHPYCAPLNQALANGNAVWLKVDESKDEVVAIQLL